ncbi:MAG: hypothetical protein GXP27_00875, partial [Planctomycetes bacterium]|nr:hypothetical protein [Planctomycetota bacterium]
LTADPLAGLADLDPDQVASLVAERSVDWSEQYMRQFLADLEQQTEDRRQRRGTDDGPLLEQATQLRPQAEYVVIMAESVDDWQWLQQVLRLQPVRRGGYKRGSQFDQVGIERVVTVSRLREVISDRGDPVDGARGTGQ